MRKTTILSLAAVLVVLASCRGGTEVGKSSVSMTPETSAQPSPSIDAQSVDMLTGTWTGKMTEPRVATFATKVTISPCDSAGLCGRYSYRTRDWYTTQRPAACGGTLTYVGIRDPSETSPDHSFVFQEADVWGRGSVSEFGDPSEVCGAAQMALTPMPDGRTLGFEEYYDGGWGNDYGLLRLGA